MNRSRKALMIQISKWEALKPPREEAAHDAELQFEFAKQTRVGVDEAWEDMQTKREALHGINGVIRRGQDILRLFDDVVLLLTLLLLFPAKKLTPTHPQPHL